jgi:hypothetical protein
MIRPATFLTLAVLVLGICAGSTFAATEKSQRAELAKYADAERYVLEQVAVGNIADLSERFKDDEQKRVLPASFVESLLINPGINIHRNGVLIAGARIVGFLNLANTKVENFAYLAQCQFDDVFFFQSVFKKGLTISGSTFSGYANFSYATVIEGLMANDVRFSNSEQTAIFDYIKVNGPFSLEKASFAGPVSLVYANVDGAFLVKDAQFLCQADAKPSCQDTKVSFNTMKIGSGFFAQGATFERPVDLINLRVNDNLEGERATFKQSATFSMMKLGHNLFLSDVKFGDEVNLNRTSVTGVIDFTRTEFQPGKYPDLSNATYLNIYPTLGMLDMIEKSPSDYTAYTALENCLQRNGFTSQADEVFMARKKYERKGLKPFDQIKSYLSQAFQGFGRIPQRVLYYDFAFIILGAFIFRRKKMVLKKPAEPANVDTPEESPPYNGFLYSLTLFAPTIDNQYTNNWRPAANHRKTRWYMTVQKWAGYIFVPLTIGIWTGIFK